MSTIFTPRAALWIHPVLGGCLLLLLPLSVMHAQQYSVVISGYTPPPRVKLSVEPGAVEVAFTDGSNLKMLLLDEKITLATRHGKLRIPVTDIQRIEFATRLSEEDSKRIHTAIVDLGSADFSKREAASIQLLKMREKAHPALLRAAETKDLEVAKRTKELIQQITANVPAEQLAIRPNDVVYTTDSMISGRIEGASLKAHTAQFGVLQMRLADTRGLRSQAIEGGVHGSTSASSTSKATTGPSYLK